MGSSRPKLTEPSEGRFISSSSSPILDERDGVRNRRFVPEKEAMLGLSFGKVLVILGATAILVGPKELPIVARLGGRIFGKAIGYIQLARGHVDGAMKQPQIQELSKNVQELQAQLDAISHGARFSLFPSPMTRRVEKQSPESNTSTNGNNVTSVNGEGQKLADHYTKAREFSGSSSGSVNLHAQATTFARLSETVNGNSQTLSSDSGIPSVLPVSAEMAKLLPQRKEVARGSDIMLEAVLEAEVAHDAKKFFAQAEKEIPILKDGLSQAAPAGTVLGDGKGEES